MIKGIMLGTLLLGGVVASIQPNNLNMPAVEEELPQDTLDRKVLTKTVEDRLTKYVRKCVRKRDPNAFMTKCYSNVETVFKPYRNWNANGPIYKNTNVKGTIDYIDCGQRNHLCEFMYISSKDSLIVRESFLRDWESAQKYAKSFCGDLSAKEKGGLF